MSQVIVEHNAPALMRDGVTLRANIYRPAADGRYPVLLSRTPYDKDQFRGDMLDPVRAARAGYVVIVQDCRGRFASEGKFSGFPAEGPDGYDSVAWAAALPYSDGNVGMFGASYYGFTQWAAAMRRPPQLKAIAPFITWLDPSDGVQFRGGALEYGLQLHWGLGMAIEATKRTMAAAGATPQEILAAVTPLVAAIDRLSADGCADLPLSELESLRHLGLAEFLKPRLQAGPGGDLNARIDHGPVDVPTLNIGGWYDLFLQGTLDNYAAERAHGRRTHLLVGPWSHLNYSSAVTEVEFGIAADARSIDLLSDLHGIHIRFFDHYLKGKPNGVETDPPVKLFVMGENRWRTLADWPPPDARPTAWYLGSGQSLAAEVPAEAEQYTYDYDPADPAPTIGGAVLIPRKFGAGARDHRPLSLRPDVLTFVSAPLTAPLTIAGRVMAHLTAASSAPDTDFVVRLLDIHPDGFMQNLTDGIIRARYRDSLREPTLLNPNEPTRLEVDLWSVAHRFQPGHQLAVQVTSSCFPRWDRNLNTAEPPGQGRVWQVARQTLFAGGAAPSAVILPVID